MLNSMPPATPRLLQNTTVNDARMALQASNAPSQGSKAHRPLILADTLDRGFLGQNDLNLSGRHASRAARSRVHEHTRAGPSPDRKLYRPSMAGAVVPGAAVQLYHIQPESDHLQV
jgi:hypothetical protein